MKVEERKSYKEIIELIPDAIYKTIEKNREKDFIISERNNRIYFVGSGSSYSVALYGMMLFNQYTDYLVLAMTPRDFIELAHKNSTVVLISQGGWNIDIIEASKKAIELNCKTTAITESEYSEFAKIIGKDRTMFLTLCGEKDCFANSQGVATSFALMLLLLDKIKNTNMSNEYDYYKIYEDSVKQINEYKYKNPNNRFYYALGCGFAKPALHECVLTINEVVLEDCSSDDFKNFTHGKHLLQYLRRENRSMLLFSEQENYPLAKEVKSKLDDIFDEVLLLTSPVPFPYSAFSHLFHVFNLTLILCHIKGRENPCYFQPPDVLLSLYKASPKDNK